MRSACSAQASIVGKIGTHGSCGSTAVGRPWRYGPLCKLDRLGDSMYETMPWLLVWPTK